MPRKMVDIPEPNTNPYNELRRKEEREKHDALRRNQEFLRRQALRHPLSRDYLISLKNLLEDMSLLDLAQQAAEERIKFEYEGKGVPLQEESIAAFRKEMDRAKYLKMVTGILETTGAFNIEEIISCISQSFYGPKPMQQPLSKQNDMEAQTHAIKQILADYLDKLDKQMKQREANILKKIEERNK